MLLNALFKKKINKCSFECIFRASLRRGFMTSLLVQETSVSTLEEQTNVGLQL